MAMTASPEWGASEVRPAVIPRGATPVIAMTVAITGIAGRAVTGRAGRSGAVWFESHSGHLPDLLERRGVSYTCHKRSSAGSRP